MQNTSQEWKSFQPAQGLKTVRNMGFSFWGRKLDRKDECSQSPRARFSYHEQRFSRLEKSKMKIRAFPAPALQPCSTGLTCLHIPAGQRRPGNFCSIAEEEWEEKHGVNWLSLQEVLMTSPQKNDPKAKSKLAKPTP